MSPSQKNPSNIWPIVALVAFLAVLAVGYQVFNKTQQWSPFKTTINYNTTILSAVQKARSEAKLVVYTFDVSAEIVKTSEKYKNVPLIDYPVSLGTTTVSLRSSGNRVQCYVPLSNVTASSFIADQKGSKLIIRLPKPLIDEDMVSIQTDPKFIDVKTDVGWARLDSHSGASLRDIAKSELKAVVIEEAKRNLERDYAEEAQKNAERMVMRLLEPVKSHLKDGVSMSVEFQ